MRIRICIEIVKRAGNSYEVRTTCEGDRDVCSLTPIIRDKVYSALVEEIRFVEKIRRASLPQAGSIKHPED